MKGLSFTGFAACGVLVVITPALLASILPPHWKDLLLLAFAILFICFAGFLWMVGKSLQAERKKKEHFDRLDRLPGLQSLVGDLEAELEALHKANRAATPMKGSGNAHEASPSDFDRIFILAADGTTRQVGEKKGSDQNRGNAIDLEINN